MSRSESILITFLEVLFLILNCQTLFSFGKSYIYVTYSLFLNNYLASHCSLFSLCFSVLFLSCLGITLLLCLPRLTYSPIAQATVSPKRPWISLASFPKRNPKQGCPCMYLPTTPPGAERDTRPILSRIKLIWI